jgi:hypothetical protein
MTSTIAHFESIFCAHQIFEEILPVSEHDKTTHSIGLALNDLQT